MLSRRTFIASLASALATTQASGSVSGRHIYVSTGFDDSNSMKGTKRQENLKAWAQVMESADFGYALKSLGKTTTLWFDAYYWSIANQVLLEPIPIPVSNPNEALAIITSKLYEESLVPDPRLNSLTSTINAMSYGLNGLMMERNRPPCIRRILNIVTDDDVREKEEPEIERLKTLQAIAGENDITVNGLIIGNDQANDHYFHKYIKTGRNAFVLSTGQYENLQEAWRDKFCRDVS